MNECLPSASGEDRGGGGGGRALKGEQSGGGRLVPGSSLALLRRLCVGEEQSTFD